ncbi:MAG: hypothetical protein ABF502_04350 [Acetobacter sp.]|uniref:hypothetical protein n=1 Tax=Acetobacter sp. TaxID=440 RepID=UPI0039EBF64A
MFPENYGKHTLIDKETGDELNADWNNADDEWLLPNGWLSAQNAANHFAYVECVSVELTPTQISEMLAGERERVIAEAIPKILIDLAELPDRTSPDDLPDVLSATAHEIEQIITDNIRILGPSP